MADARKDSGDFENPPVRKTVRHRAFFVRVFVFMLFATIALFLRILAEGIPLCMVEKIEEILSTDALTVEMENVAFSPVSGLSIGKLSVYPRGIVHPPLLEMEGVSSRFRFFAFVSGRIKSAIKSVNVRSLKIFKLSPSVSGWISETDVPFSSGGTNVIPCLSMFHVECSYAEILGGEFRDLSANVSSVSDRVVIEKLRVNVGVGTECEQPVAGELQFDAQTSKIKAVFDGWMKPMAAIPILDQLELPGIVRWLSYFEFPSSPPKLSTKLDYDPAGGRRIEFSVKSGHFIYKGVNFLNLSGEVDVYGTGSWDRLDIIDLRASRPEGELDGDLLIDLNKDVLNLDAVSTIDPGLFLRVAGLADADFVLPVRFGNLVRIFCAGMVDFAEDRTKYDLSGNLDAGFLSFRGVPFSNLTFNGNFTDRLWTVAGMKADSMGGVFGGNAVFTPVYVGDREEFTYLVDLSFKKVSLCDVLKVYKMESAPDLSGTLDVSTSFSGRITGDDEQDRRAASGAGTLKVRDAHLFRIPLFAGFTDFMAKNVPGLDFVLSQNSLDADIIYSDTVTHIYPLRIEGSVFSMSGNLDIGFDGNIDMRLRAHLLNRDTWVGSGLHYILFPVSKIFEMEASGPFANPSWTVPSLTFNLQRGNTDSDGKNNANVKPAERK